MLSKLPYYVAKDNMGHLLVPKSEGGDKSNRVKEKTNMFLGQHPHSIHTWNSVTPAYREIFQNMFDGIVSARHNRLDGLMMTREGSNVFFHTAECIYGAVIMNADKTRISFVNFAPNVTDLAQVIQLGASKKRRCPNQIGQHGEGLKRAMLWFSVHGYTNETFFGLFGPDKRLRLVKLVFKMKYHETLRADDMCVSIRNINPETEAIRGFPFRKAKNEPLPHAFCVTLTNERGNIPLFNPDLFLVNDWAIVRGQRMVEVTDVRTAVKITAPDRTDVGYLVPNEPGRVYVFNFYINTYSAHFGYNLFIKHVTRDRDQLDMNEVHEGIASVWMERFRANVEELKRFCDTVMPKRSDAQLSLQMTLEELAIRYFDADTKLKIYMYWRGPTPRILATEGEIANYPHIDAAAFVPINSRQLAAVCDVRKSIEERVKETLLDELKTANQKQVVLPSLKIPVILLTSVRITFPIKFIIQKLDAAQTLYINADRLLGGRTTLENGDRLVFWQCFIFDILPACFGKSEQHLFDRKAIFAEIQRTDEKEEEEDGEVVPTDPRKRYRKEVSPPASPPGYEPYSGPQLFVLKKKN